MKDAILIELAEKWEYDGKTPENEDGSDSAKISNERKKASRECKRECADTLRVLVDLLGYEK